MKTVLCALLMAFTAWSTVADGSSISKPAEIRAALSAHQRAIHVKQGDGRAGGRQPLCDRKTNATLRAGYDGHFVVKYLLYLVSHR